MLGSLRATEVVCVVCVVCVLGVYDGTVLVMDGRVITTEQNARDEYQGRVSAGGEPVSSGVVPVALAVGGSVAFLGVCLYVTWRKTQHNTDNATANSVGNTEHSRVPTTAQSLYPVTGFASAACDSHEYMVNPYHAVPSPYHGMVSPYGAAPVAYNVQGRQLFMCTQ